MTRLRRASLVLAAGLALGAMTSGSPARADDTSGTAAPSKRAWLGVDLEKGASGGVLIKHVINNSPAAKAGLADGDQVVSVLTFVMTQEWQPPLTMSVGIYTYPDITNIALLDVAGNPYAVAVDLPAE